MAQRLLWLGWNTAGLCALAESSPGYGKGGGSSAAPMSDIWPAPGMWGQPAAHYRGLPRRPWPGGLWGGDDGSACSRSSPHNRTVLCRQLCFPGSLSPT